MNVKVKVTQNGMHHSAFPRGMNTPNLGFLHGIPSLVLVRPRKTRPFITERLLMGRKESNQTNKHAYSRN